MVRARSTEATKPFSIRYTQRELARLGRAAKSLGFETGAWIRQVSLETAAQLLQRARAKRAKAREAKS